VLLAVLLAPALCLLAKMAFYEGVQKSWPAVSLSLVLIGIVAVTLSIPALPSSNAAALQLGKGEAEVDEKHLTQIAELETDEDRADRCAAALLERVEAVSPKAAANIRRTVVNPPPPVRTSNRPIIIDPMPGTTGTQTVGCAMAAAGLRVFHDRVVYEPFVVKKESGPVRKQYVLPVKKAMNWSETEECHKTAETQDYVAAFENLDALFDVPIATLWYDIFRAFPNSKVIVTDRSGADWTAKRLAHPNSQLPYIRPCGRDHGQEAWKAVGTENIVEIYDASREFIMCVVPPERMLIVNVFTDNGDPEGFWKAIADFVGTERARSPLEANCQLPRSLKVAC